MRLLFVSSTTSGGSGRSQRELATRLVERGHDVRFLVDDKRPARLVRSLGERFADLSERLPRLGFLRRLEAFPGSRTRRFELDGVVHDATPIPQNVLPATVSAWRPDVVIGNSMVRFSWRRIRAHCATRGIPTVLYVREVTSLALLDIESDPGDAVVANSRSLVAGVEQAGLECVFVPSVVDPRPTRTTSSRDVVLLVNPATTHGIDLLWEIAAALPEIPFVLQESWELEPGQLDEIATRMATLPNVTLNRRRDPGPELYARARILLVPHRIDNRPRVVAEAHSNSIPALVSDFGGLREAVGSGGLVLPTNDPGPWVEAIRALWQPGDYYDRMAAAARAESERPEIDPETVVGRFESVLEQVTAPGSEQ